MTNPLDYLEAFSKQHKARYDLWYVLVDKTYKAELTINKQILKASRATPEKAAEDIIEQLRTVKGLRIRYNETGDQPITGEQGELF